jgi:hypothetical protein
MIKEMQNRIVEANEMMNKRIDDMGKMLENSRVDNLKNLLNDSIL